MKSNLFKKIGAMVTTVAMIASLGTVAFADASITIGEATVSEPVNGIRTVTVPYTTTDVTGEVAVLGYVGTEAANDVETYAAYDETKHTIVGIEQEAVVTTGTPSITFKVKQDNSEDQSNVTGKDYLYITLGAQGVNEAETAVIPLATEADDTIEVTTAAWAGATTDEVAYGSTADAKKAAAKAIIDAGKIKFNDTYEITVAALVAKNLITIAEPTVDGNKYTYALSFTAGGTGVMSSEKEIVLGTVAAINVDVTITEAAAPPVEDPDNFVTIGAAEAEYDETNNIFDVTVPYTTTNAKENGEVAMMAYIGRTSAFTDDTETEYTNETDMRIIGIAQKTNGTNGGTFEYKVTGDIGENTYMVVKVGAQGVNVAPDMVAIPLTKTTTPVVTDITAAYGTVADLEDLANDNIATVSAALSGKTVSIKNDSNAEVATYVLGTATAEKLATATTVNGATYNYATTIAAATDVTETGENTNVIIPADFKVYFNITVAPVEWTVTSGTMDAITVDNIADADDDAEVLAAVKAAIVGKKITLTSGTTGQTAETTVADTWTVTKVDADTYKVTVPADATLANVLPEGADVTMAQIDVEFGVTVNEIPAEPVVLTTASLAKTEETVTDAANAEAAVKAINLTIGTYTKTIAEWITAGVVEIAASDNVYTVTVKAEQEIATNVTTGTIAPMTVTVTVQSGEKYIVGDVDGNGRVQGADWMYIVAYLGRTYSDYLPARDLDFATSVSANAADIDGNGRITGADWMYIVAYLGRTQGTGVGVERTMGQ